MKTGYCAKGNKTDRTFSIELKVWGFFQREMNIILENEFRLPGGKSADFGWVSRDRDEQIIIEIKQSQRDFKTGYGLNFVGNYNYLAIPPELVGYAILFLKDIGREDVGILEVCKTVKIIREPRFYVNKNWENKHPIQRTHMYYLSAPHLLKRRNNHEHKQTTIN